MENQKEKLIEAKALVSQGKTLKETSQRTGLSIDILKKHSAKENWIAEQRTFFQESSKKLQGKNLKKFIKNRQEAIENIYYIEDMAMELVKERKIPLEKALKIILESEKGINELLGIMTPLELSKIELEEKRLELEKMKTNDQKDKTGIVTDRESAVTMLKKARGMKFFPSSN